MTKVTITLQDGEFIARHSDHVGIIGVGDTEQEALQELAEALGALIYVNSVKASKERKLLELYKKQIENITSFDYWKVLPIDVIQTKRWIDEIDKTEKKIRQLEKELEEMK